MVASTAAPGSAYTTGQCAGGRDSRKGYFYPNRPQRACLGRTGDRAWDLDGPRRSHRPRNHLSGCWVEGLSTPSIGPRAFVGLLYRDGMDRTQGLARPVVHEPDTCVDRYRVRSRWTGGNGGDHGT